MNITDINILNLIPQRPPFVMVDKLISYTPATTITQFHVGEDNLFAEEGRFSLTGLVENIAQTCAVRMGYINQASSQPIKVGVIGAIKNFTVNQLPLVGSLLTTRIDVLEEVFNVVLVHASITCDETLIAETDMKIALTDIDAEPPILTATKEIEIRFSEVDSMNIVWHGNYMLYFEDAREAFGRKYGLDYLTIFHNNYYAPLVDISFQYTRPLIYGQQPVVKIFYRPTDAAKIVFDYEIWDKEGKTLFAKGHSVQVFMDLNYQLVWGNPPFYEEWKKKHGVL